MDAAELVAAFEAQLASVDSPRVRPSCKQLQELAASVGQDTIHLGKLLGADDGNNELHDGLLRQGTND